MLLRFVSGASAAEVSIEQRHRATLITVRADDVGEGHAI